MDGHPENFNEIATLAIAGPELEDIIEKLFVRVNARLEGFLSESADRLEMNKAYAFLYGLNQEVSKLEGNFPDLKAAASYVLKPENKAVWADQAGVKKAEDSWRNAENAYKKGDYAKAQIYGAEAIKAFRNIQLKGALKVEQKPLLSDQFLQQLILGLATLLVLVFLFKYRSKIMGFLQPKQESEDENLKMGWKNE